MNDKKLPATLRLAVAVLVRMLFTRYVHIIILSRILQKPPGW